MDLERLKDGGLRGERR